MSSKYKVRCTVLLTNILSWIISLNSRLLTAAVVCVTIGSTKAVTAQGVLSADRLLGETQHASWLTDAGTRHQALALYSHCVPDTLQGAPDSHQTRQQSSYAQQEPDRTLIHIYNASNVHFATYTRLTIQIFRTAATHQTLPQRVVLSEAEVATDSCDQRQRPERQEIWRRMKEGAVPTVTRDTNNGEVYAPRNRQEPCSNNTQ
jgi:hypothetical protein